VGFGAIPGAVGACKEGQDSVEVMCYSKAMGSFPSTRPPGPAPGKGKTSPGEQGPRGVLKKEKKTGLGRTTGFKMFGADESAVEKGFGKDKLALVRAGAPAALLAARRGRGCAEQPGRDPRDLVPRPGDRPVGSKVFCFATSPVQAWDWLGLALRSSSPLWPPVPGAGVSRGSSSAPSFSHHQLGAAPFPVPPSSSHRWTGRRFMVQN